MSIFFLPCWGRWPLPEAKVPWLAQQSRGPSEGCLGIADGFPLAPGALQMLLSHHEIRRTRGDGSTQPLQALRSPSTQPLGRRWVLAWGVWKQWAGRRAAQTAGNYVVIFSQALTETCPFYNGDRKDYKQSLPPKQLIFTRKIEEQGKGQFCLVS